jgi:hypothetical protein
LVSKSVVSFDSLSKGVLFVNLIDLRLSVDILFLGLLDLC